VTTVFVREGTGAKSGSYRLKPGTAYGAGMALPAVRAFDGLVTGKARKDPPPGHGRAGEPGACPGDPERPSTAA
jgi:hypothetical protein